MPPERPDPEIDISMDVDPTVLDLCRIIGGLALAGQQALMHRDMEEVNGCFGLQSEIIKANPKATILADELYGRYITLGNDEFDSVEDFLEQHDALEGIDPEEIRENAAGTDIEIE